MDLQKRLWLIGGTALAVLLIAILGQSLTTDPYTNELRSIREQKDERFRNAPDSPVPKAKRASFDGLPYFDINRKLFLKGRFVPEEQPPGGLIEANRDLTYAGKVMFDYNGESHELMAYWKSESQKKRLFIPFADATNGETTYGGGRYLEVPILANRGVEIDFNRAYNPQCAYDPDYICPKAPPENRLPFAVRAGEKDFPYPAGDGDHGSPAQAGSAKPGSAARLNE